MSADYIADKIGDSGDIAVLEGLEGFNNQNVLKLCRSD